jgi:hypothetical protein
MIISRRTAKNFNWARAVGRACLGLALLALPVRAQQPTPGNVVLVQVPPAAEKTSEEKVVTPEQAIKQRQETEQAIKQRQEKITVKFKVTAVQTLRVSKSNVFHVDAGYTERFVLKDGDSFAVQLVPPAMDTIRRLGIPDKHFAGTVVQVTGPLQPGQPAFGTGQYQIVVTDLTQIEVVGK